MGWWNGSVRSVISRRGMGGVGVVGWVGPKRNITARNGWMWRRNGGASRHDSASHTEAQRHRERREREMSVQNM